MNGPLGGDGTHRLPSASDSLTTGAETTSNGALACQRGQSASNTRFHNATAKLSATKMATRMITPPTFPHLLAPSCRQGVDGTVTPQPGRSTL
jgi:hypothetical protein